jgi:hypothetical protein
VIAGKRGGGVGGGLLDDVVALLRRLHGWRGARRRVCWLRWRRGARRSGCWLRWRRTRTPRKTEPGTSHVAQRSHVAVDRTTGLRGDPSLPWSRSRRHSGRGRPSAWRGCPRALVRS